MSNPGPEINPTLSKNLPISEFGAFSEDGREYIITNVRTPRPWTNVISYGNYGMVLSQAGGGFSWRSNCQVDRLTRWEQDLSTDLYGRFVYLQDLERPGEVFSTSFEPTRDPASRLRCRHGFGYSVFEGEMRGIGWEHTVFVPVHGDHELWFITVTNLSDRPRRVRCASYVDWYLGAPGEWHREFHRLFLETKVEGADVFVWKHPGIAEGKRELIEANLVAFHSLVSGHETDVATDKGGFLGFGGTLAAPEALTTGVFPPSAGRWDEPIASIAAEFELSPGESRILTFAVGGADTLDSAKCVLQRIKGQDSALELRRVKEHWVEMLSMSRVTTPDPTFDALTNDWLRYQAISCRLDARCAYYQQGGAYGYRDQLQDSLMCLLDRPERASQQLALHAEAMYEDGGVRHWWHPSGKGHVRSHHSDTSLWLAYGVLAYLDETNDLDFLDRRVSLLNRITERSAHPTNILGACRRGIDRALDLRSSRGLPLIGSGDWNDGLSHAGIEGKGESVWLGMFLYGVLLGFAPILDLIGETGRAGQYRSAAEDLRAAVNNFGWDGNWYLAGTRDDGRPIGGHECRNGSIHLNPQTWAVISGIAPPERVAAAMQSVRERLLKPYGALLLAPAYNEVDPDIGYITRYAPGLRENGGVYSHASVWAVQALAMIGDVDGAYRLYRGMCPPVRAAQDARLYAAEPYVMPGNSDGPDSPHEGRAGWTWYTGSAAWMVRTSFDWILGVRATRQGLLIAPQLPHGWPGARVKRRFRDAEVIIELERVGEHIEAKVNGQSVGRTPHLLGSACAYEHVEVPASQATG